MNKPSQFDHLTKTLIRNTSRRQAIKGLAATAIGGTFGIGIISTAFADRLSHPDQQITELNIRIWTGSDDLRRLSEAVAYVHLVRDQQVEELSQSLNDGALWDNSTNNLVTFQLNSQLFQPAPFVRDIKEFGIRFFSGQSGPFDTGDNWNMDQILVTYHVNNAPDDTLLFMSGSPLKRFVSDHDEWHVTF